MTDYLARVLELSNLLAAVEVFVRLLAGWYVLRVLAWFFWHILALDSWLQPPPLREKASPLAQFLERRALRTQKTALKNVQGG